MVRIRRREEPAIGELHRRMEQVMERLLHELASPVDATWVPRVDIYETEEALAVILEVPGVDRDKIEVAVEGPFLHVSGERLDLQGATCVRWHQMEIVRGPFERVLALPHEVDAAGVTATYKDGFLLITLPRKTSRARAVPIEPS